MELYQLQDLLGQGDFGEVYRAIDTETRQPVAVKLIYPRVATQDGFRYRLENKARVVAALRHPHINKVFAYLDQQDGFFVAMNLVQAGGLDRYLSQKLQPFIGEALMLVRQLAEALQFAHDRGIFHLNIKPGNVLLKPVVGAEPFYGLLTDFGLGSPLEVSEAPSPESLAYAAPEFFAGHAVEGRADIYALGALLYRLVVGDLPFHPSSIESATQMHLEMTPPALGTRHLGLLAADLKAMIAKAMAKNPAHRFQTPADMAAAIQEVEKSPTVMSESTERMDVTSLGGYLAMMTAQYQVPDSEIHSDQLVILRQGDEPRYVDLTRHLYVLGRDSSADIVLASSRVSRRHATLQRRQDGTYIVSDLGSTNRTYLDQRPLPPHVAQPWPPRQSLHVGEFTLKLRLAP